MPEPAAPKRFYTAVSLVPGEDGLVLALDGRPARTPGRAPLALPTRALAEAVAAEWDAQTDRIDPRAMPLTRLANSTIDGVAGEAAAVRDEIARYAATDLVFYRAGDPASLVAEQAAAWDPVLDFARDAFGARFILGEGVMHVEQPARSVDRVRAALESEPAFALAPLHVLTTLTGSALIAFMVSHGRLDVAGAWRAAHVDELFQERQWGADAEASARREAREAEFRHAARFLALGRSNEAAASTGA